MTKPALLVTDFDGTLTRNDFFNLVVEAFAPAGLGEHWSAYQAGRLTHFEALQGIFAGIRGGEADLLALLSRAGLEPELPACVKALHRAGWEVVVASAGCAWYIDRLLASCGVRVTVHANPGRFVPGRGLLMELPTGSPYFCRLTGIDKAAIVREGLAAGRVVGFAGDGALDAAAARLVPSRLRFARAELAAALDAERLPYRRFERWREVAQALLAEKQISP
jgi:2-hydroxy-3-keto-5-methylthiopentenyl-1-phosphate phosphatase